jgi:C4-dicarboxylate transporter DctM subunit
MMATRAGSGHGLGRPENPVNLSIGLYTPLFGLNLFASHAIFEVDIGQVYRGVLPFVLINFVTLLVITYVPSISMVLIGHGP